MWNDLGRSYVNWNAFLKCHLDIIIIIYIKSQKRIFKDVCFKENKNTVNISEEMDIITNLL